MDKMDNMSFVFFGIKDSDEVIGFFDTSKDIPAYGYAYARKLKDNGDIVGDILKLIVTIKMELIEPTSRDFDWIPIEKIEIKGIASDKEESLLDLEHPQSLRLDGNLLPNDCLFYI